MLKPPATIADSFPSRGVVSISDVINAISNKNAPNSGKTAVFQEKRKLDHAAHCDRSENAISRTLEENAPLPYSANLTIRTQHLYQLKSCIGEHIALGTDEHLIRYGPIRD